MRFFANAFSYILEPNEVILENSAECSPAKINLKEQTTCINIRESKTSKNVRKFISLKSQIEEFFCKRSCEVIT